MTAAADDLLRELDLLPPLVDDPVAWASGWQAAEG